jgi:hypothetical protein
MAKTKIPKQPWHFKEGFKSRNDGAIRESTNVNHKQSSRYTLLPIASREFFNHPECKTFCSGSTTIHRNDDDAKVAYKEYIYSI